ncbi:putative IRON-SULFUR-BINDING REDUCTASE domain protein [Mycobacterium xenopi 3993]|nr:putative IRON-SULFUR-BINDING REDUCTASE domain protein [Mycobacterium xenopi 3993]
MDTQTLIRLVVGLGMTAIVGLFAARRAAWLVKLTLSGQPAPAH